MSSVYCGDNCNHTGPHHYPPAARHADSAEALLLDLDALHRYALKGRRSAADIAGLDGAYDRLLAALAAPQTRQPAEPCRWSWNGSKCQRPFGHHSPHLLDVEEPWTRPVVGPVAYASQTSEDHGDQPVKENQP